MIDYIDVQQVYKKDLSFWRPTPKRAYNDPLWASVSQVSGLSQISIPVTTRAVQRSNGYAAYLRYPFYFEPIWDDPPPVSSLVQGYPDRAGIVSPRVATLFNFSHLTVTSDRNPGVIPTIEEGDILLVEGSTNQGGVTPVVVTTPERTTTHVGVLGQVAMGRETYSDTQDLWFFDGNTSLESISGVSPELNANYVTVTWDGSTATVTSSEVGVYPRLFSAGCVIRSDRFIDQLFVTGGKDGVGAPSKSTYIYSKNDVATPTTDCPIEMVGAKAISHPTANVILVTGGFNGAGTDSINDVYCYSPYDESWTELDPMVVARRDHQLIAISGDRILAVGGRSGTNGGIELGVAVPINKCEVLFDDSDPGEIPAGTFALTGSMAQARVAFGMTKLPDGKVLVCGGVGGSPNYPVTYFDWEYNHELSSCEIYDPDTGRWTSIASMLEPHSYCVCTCPPGTNKVYVYGGYSSTSVEYLDLTTMQWHRAVRYLPAAIVLGTPFATACGFMGLVGGCNLGSPVQWPFTVTINDGPAGSTWNCLTPNEPEYTRYDGLNGEWRVESIDVGQDLMLLSSWSLGDYTNTSVQWLSDPDVDHETTRFVMAKAVASVG